MYEILIDELKSLGFTVGESCANKVKFDSETGEPLVLPNPEYTLRYDVDFTVRLSCRNDNLCNFSKIELSAYKRINSNRSVVEIRTINPQNYQVSEIINVVKCALDNFRSK